MKKINMITEKTQYNPNFRSLPFSKVEKSS